MALPWISAAGAPAVPIATDILDGFQTFAATTVATTVITVPANRIWSGVVVVSCSCAEAAPGAVSAQAKVAISVAGVGATPVPGTYLQFEALAGAGAAAGTTGEQGWAGAVVPFIVVAGAVAATIQATTTQAGTISEVDVSCIGLLL